MRLETSRKIYNDGKIITGRYTVSISLYEFSFYTRQQQEKLFEIVDFDIRDFVNILNSGKEFRMFFGEDGGVGKVYFDELNICYESNGRDKRYIFQKPGWIDIYVVSSDSPDKLFAIFKMIKEGKNVNWYAGSKDYITIYYRPEVYLSEEQFNQAWFHLIQSSGRA